MVDQPRQALGILEIIGVTPSMAALDAAEKAGTVRVVQAELNDQLGLCIKLLGEVADVKAAVAAGDEVARQFAGAQCVAHVLAAPDERIATLIKAPIEYSPIMEADIVFNPRFEPVSGATPPGTAGDVDETDRTDEQTNQASDKEHTVSEQASYAIGFIETQGFTAVIEAIDTACKAANVEVIGKEKLGGGYVTVIIKGDVAAVNAAINTGQEKVHGLGNLIAAHVIPSPSASVLALMPEG